MSDENSPNINMDLEGAIYDNEVDEFDELVKAGADIRKGFEFAFVYARNKISREMIRKFIEHGITHEEVLFKIVSSDDIFFKFIDIVMEKENVLNAKDKSGNTAIYYASRFSLLRPLKFLLENGANPNIIGRGQWAPLNLAVYLNNPEVVRLLLNGGASINKQQYRTEDGEVAFLFEHALEGKFSAKINSLILEARAKNILAVFRGKVDPYLGRSIAAYATEKKPVPRSSSQEGGRRTQRNKRRRHRTRRQK